MVVYSYLLSSHMKLFFLQVAPNGLLVTFLGSFSGTVGVPHLPDGELSTEDFQVKKKFKGRLLWVDVSNKTVGLTLQKCVVAGRAFEFPGIEIGDTFQGVFVYVCVCVCVYACMCVCAALYSHNNMQGP